MLLKTKLLILFLVAGIVPIAIVGITSSSLASSSLMQKSYDQLVSIREIKKNQISNYFDGREGDIGILVETVLNPSHGSRLKAEGDTAWKRIHHAQLHSRNEDRARTYPDRRDPSGGAARDAFGIRLLGRQHRRGHLDQGCGQVRFVSAGSYGDQRMVRSFPHRHLRQYSPDCSKRVGSRAEPAGGPPVRLPPSAKPSGKSRSPEKMKLFFLIWHPTPRQTGNLRHS